MAIVRPDPMKVLGVDIHANMDASTMLSLLQPALLTRPALQLLFAPAVAALTLAEQLHTQTLSALNGIITSQNNISNLKSALNGALKAYNIANRAALISMDAKPAVQGSPPATGIGIALSGVSQTVSDLVSQINSAESQLDSDKAALVVSSKNMKDASENATGMAMSQVTQLSV